MDYRIFDFSELDKEFYEFDRNLLLSNKSLEQRLSSSSINYSLIKNDKDFLKKAVKFLTKISYSLFTYVTKEKKPVIDLNFESDSSYCELKSNRICISLKLLLEQKLPYQVRVDSIVGIIFHEFFHKRFTIKSILTEFLIQVKDLSQYYQPDNKYLDAFFELYINTNLKKHILNILEDKRIERLGIKDLPGYGFFFDETRKTAFFNLKNRSIEKIIDNFPGYLYLDFLLIKILMPELEEETLKKYEWAVESSISSAGVNILNHIKDINNYIKLNWSRVNADDLKTLLIVTEEIEQLIPTLDRVDLNAMLSSKNTFSKGNDYLDSYDKDLLEVTNDLLNEIEILIEETQKELIEAESEKVVKEKIKHQLEGCTNYTHINLHSFTTTKVDNLLLNEAKKLSKNLCQNLGFLNSRYNRINSEYELLEGEIDEDDLYSIKYNKNLFYNEENIKGYSLDFGILLDESGSMFNLIDDAKLACLTLGLSLYKEKHINLYIYGHTADQNNTESFTSNKSIDLYKYYNTLEKTVNLNSIFNATSRFSNADGFAIYKMGEIMGKSKAKRKILVVISDGQPSAIGYFGNAAVEHTRKSVEHLERNGITVIQVCMAQIENSSKMFKNFIPFSKDKNFILSLKSILMKELKTFHTNI